jgi:hypothetical protein
MTRRYALASLLAVALAPLGCSDVTGDDLVVPTLELTATPDEAGVGDEILFRYQAAGNYLDALTVSFGDEEGGVIALAGARRADGEVPHVYAQPGSYQVTARLSDAAIGTVEADVAVIISPVTALTVRAPAARATTRGRTSPR